jgi:endogenous inhibitor of DNA gyrase (YacG/DUF329 family)
MLEALELRDHISREVLSHLCSSRCHGFGQAIELCETRRDCVIVVTCPTCGKQFTLDDEQYDDLLAWTRGEGKVIACGVEPLPA